LGAGQARQAHRRAGRETPSDCRALSVSRYGSTVRAMWCSWCPPEVLSSSPAGLQVGAMSAMQLALLSPAQLAALSPSALGGVTAQQLSKLEPEQMAALTPSQVRARWVTP
jgi:hypothetical protein